MKISLFLALVTGIALSGCKDEALEKRLKEIEDRQLNQSLNTTSLENQLNTLGAQTASQFNYLDSRYSKVRVVPDDSAFAIYQSEYGRMLILTESVEPYLDGFKINLKIGNPLNCSLDKVTIRAQWPTGTNATNNTLIHESKSAPMSKRIVAGSWNDMQLTITPLTAAQLRNTDITLSAESVYLNNSK